MHIDVVKIMKNALTEGIVEISGWIKKKTC